MDPGTLPPLARRIPNVRFVVPAASLALALERTGAADSQLIGLDAGDKLDLCQACPCERRAQRMRRSSETSPGRCRYSATSSIAAAAKIFHSGDCAPFDGFVGEIRL